MRFKCVQNMVGKNTEDAKRNCRKGISIANLIPLPSFLVFFIISSDIELEGKSKLPFISYFI